MVKLFEDKMVLNKLFKQFIEEKINRLLFPFDVSDKDKGFRISCEVLSFLKLKDLFHHKKVKEIENNLETVILEIHKIHVQYNFNSKI